MRQNALSPRRLRQLPLILAWSLAILIACSQVLFVQSTPKSAVKYRTWSIRSAMRLASLEASLLRPLTPGALAAAPCSAVLAYRPRIWPRVAGGRLDAPASVAASTARRALLGLSIFTLVGGLATANMSAIKDWFAGRAMTGTARFLIAVAALFALLWLSEIVPDLFAGNPSRSATHWKVPTNPMHVLDLAFFLPAVIMRGLLLRRQHPLGYATAAGQLVWGSLRSDADRPAGGRRRGSTDAVSEARLGRERLGRRDDYVSWQTEDRRRASPRGQDQRELAQPSLRELKAFCRIRSYIATARAHRVPVFTALRDAFLDDPWSIPT